MASGLRLLSGQFERAVFRVKAAVSLFSLRRHLLHQRGQILREEQGGAGATLWCAITREAGHAGQADATPSPFGAAFHCSRQSSPGWCGLARCWC